MGAWTSPFPASLPVVPGEETGCELKIRNTGTVVDAFTFVVLGDAAPWIQVAPSSLNLLPGTEGAVQLQLRPPRQPSTRAGPMQLGLKVVSREDPEHPVIGSGVLQISAYSETTAQLVPRTSHTLRAAEHRLTVANQGNERIEATLTASDPDNLLAFDVTPPIVAVDPGGTASAVVRAQAGKLLITGREQSRPFQVAITAGGSPPITVEGTLSQKALLPSWVLLLVGALVALVAGLAFLKWLLILAAAFAAVAVALKVLRKPRGRPAPPAQ